MDVLTGSGQITNQIFLLFLLLLFWKLYVVCVLCVLSLAISCTRCGRHYKLKSSLLNHQRWECGKEPQFKCYMCSYKAKQKAHLLTHMKYRHKTDNIKTDYFFQHYIIFKILKFSVFRKECSNISFGWEQDINSNNINCHHYCVY